MRHRPLIDGLDASYVTAKRASPSTLALEQTLLSFHSPTITTERPIVAHDSMTRDDNCQSIIGACPRYGTRRGRTAERRRDLAV